VTPARPAWGTKIVEGVVAGHPCRLFEPRCRSIAELAEQAERWSDRVFLVQGDRRLTFGETLAAVGSARGRLAALGIGAGDRVMILASNSPDWVVAFLAVTTAGAVAVAGNRWWGEPDVSHAVRLTHPRLVVADSRGAQKLAGAAPVLIDIGEFSGRAAAEAPPASIAEADTAYLLFTSGTTSHPKAVVLSHRSAVANVHNLALAAGQLPHQLEDDDPQKVSVCALPLFHISGVQTLLQSLVTGNRLVFLPGRFDPGAMLELIERERITHWAAVPAMAAMVLDHPDLAKRDLSSLQMLFMGGAPVPSELVERAREAFPTVRHSVGRGYGSTEAGGTVALGGGRAIQEQPTRDGFPLPLAEVRIENGELLVRSPAVMDGYLGLPPEEQPVDSEGWLHTGDVARIDDAGFIHITDRIKDIIIRGGENIASTAIEDCLLRHPAVAEAAAVGLAHPVWGEEVGAVVRLRTDFSATAEELSAFAAERLPGFAIPTRWWFPTDPLPLTESGKVKKAALRAAWPA
jgi:long-chain acyl-CoA synthetase